MAIYFQVFFLFVFFENKEELEKKLSSLDESRLPSVSFIIPCFDEENTVCRTLESILKLDYPNSLLKIIVVDDGSQDNTWQSLSVYKSHPQITLKKQSNRGKAEALNNGLKEVTTDLVVSFDADTEIRVNALKEIVNKFVVDEKIMAIGGTVLIQNPKTMIQKAQSIEYKMFSFTKKMLGLMGAVLVVPGAFSVFRREVFDIVGGYKNAHNLEDVEMTLRMQKHGLKVDHCHTAFVLTKGPESMKKLFRQRLRWCCGFIENLKDYKYMLFNKKYGDFGFFTLPLNLFSYIMIIFVFFLGLYKISLFFQEKITEFLLVGFTNFDLININWFFIDVRVSSLLSIVMLMFILIGIILGKKTSRASMSLWSVVCFIFIYSFLAPLWILRSMYNSILSVKTSWR